MAAQGSILALIVARRPYEQRAARADIDLALAAAAMDFEVQVYFQGSAVLQLTAARDPGNARLPAGYRAWAALPDLAPTRFFAESQWLDFCYGAGLELFMPVKGLDRGEMRRHWRNCAHAMVI